jgi:hypothetical protein
VSENGDERRMGDKTMVNDGSSVTEFDAENVQTDKEKKRDGKAKPDPRKAKKE